MLYNSTIQIVSYCASALERPSSSSLLLPPKNNNNNNNKNHSRKRWPLTRQCAREVTSDPEITHSKRPIFPKPQNESLCVCVWVWVCVCVCVCVCVFVCVVCVCMHACVRVCVCMRMHTCMCVCVRLHDWIRLIHIHINWILSQVKHGSGYII